MIVQIIIVVAIIWCCFSILLVGIMLTRKKSEYEQAIDDYEQEKYLKEYFDAKREKELEGKVLI